MKREFDLEAFFIGLAFMSLGFGIPLWLWKSGDYGILSFKSFYEFFLDEGFGLCILFFLGIAGTIILFYTIINYIFPRKKDVLYLLKEKGTEYNDELIFVDRKGRKYYYDNKDNIVYKKGYYDVLRTMHKVDKVYGESSVTFEIKEKKSYWLTWYTPMGTFEDILLLPIAYVFLTPALISFIISEGFVKIFGLIIGLYPGYLIIYDIVKKYKEW